MVPLPSHSLKQWGQLGEILGGVKFPERGASRGLMKGKIRSEIRIPAAVVQEADLDPDYKLACQIDPESGRIQISEANYRYDLTDLPEELLGTFRECGICLSDLEGKLIEEKVIYGVE